MTQIIKHYSKIQKVFNDNPLPIIIFSALLIQLLGRYYASEFRIGRYFYISWVVLRIPIPLLILFFLRVPLSRIGLGLPKVDKSAFKIILFLGIGFVVVFASIHLFPGYLDSYTNSFRLASTRRLWNFTVFTLSTLPGWEFLHRSFLLMGVIYVLTEKDGLPRGSAEKIAILYVWIFEVLFHFFKPELEALGMLVGSPLLSYVALRTSSVWTAFILHLCVEFIFMFSL